MPENLAKNRAARLLVVATPCRGDSLSPRLLPPQNFFITTIEITIIVTIHVIWIKEQMQQQLDESE